MLLRDGRALVNLAVYRTRFTIPSGFVEAGESLEAALRREFEEETGVSTTVGRLLLVRHKVLEPTASDVYFAFEVTRRSGTPEARPPEIAEFREVPLAEVASATWISELSRTAILLAAEGRRSWSRSPWAGGEVPGLSTELYPAAGPGGPGRADPPYSPPREVGGCSSPPFS